MSVNPNDTTINNTERLNRRLTELQQLPDKVRKGGGASGAEGKEGKPAGLRYKFNTGTTEVDPGTGKLALNNAAPGSATLFRISETDADGNGLGPFLAGWDDSTNTVRGQIKVRSLSSTTDLLIFNITGALTDKGTWDQIVVTNVTSSGTFSNEEEVLVDFTRSGDKGADGANGEKGETGATGESGKEGPPGASTAGDWKDSVRVATTANIAIATALNPGDTIDGVVLAENDRVLVKDQTTTKENGIWVVKAAPVRSTDADAAGELSGGTMVYVEAGAQAGRVYVIDTAGSITPGTTSHVWRVLNPRVVAFGRVTSAGAKTSGEGFTVSKLVAGNYEVKFAIAAPIAPAVQITPDTSTIAPVYRSKSITTTSFIVEIFNASGLAATDCAFSFKAEC